VLVERALEGEALVEVGGIGYRVTVAAGTAARLGGAGSPTFLWIHHHIREDQQVLYGFAGRAERDCFELLLAAHGVGPALALAILSVHGPLELARILADDDLASLCLVPGVGRKTAARLAVELKSRLLDDEGRPRLVDGGPAGARVPAGAGVPVATGAASGNGAAGGIAGGTDGAGAAVGEARTNGSASGELLPAIDAVTESPRSIVRQALAELGYGADETRRALAVLDQDESLADADERVLLRAALRRMGR
jgi:Holliday junction DNA helicase RuvA